ncbi:acyl-CoA synthetase [Erythrobacteraceae bacterium CFH 75059]|uniref:acyl-CoA synthetase n=1 Tax=Qipengyuania thermophila TaxID=2509361 RepID=UPI0010218F3D|nr:acyl-CoA synthetase [Qipengyuania thermophila]TCD06567.1 acyl-CoA synthetase [Erythrobacteraceae bacterium CFH 75059]
MHPITHAKSRPDHPAVIMAGSGERLSYAEMDALANRMARLLRRLGLAPGDAFGLLMENRLEYLPLAWASQRIGTVLVPISTHLTASEVAYILEDSGSRVLVTSARFGDLARDVCGMGAGETVQAIVMDAAEEDPRAAGPMLAEQSAEPLPDPVAGYEMLYSSGTTGRPKGIRPVAPPDPDPLVAGPLVMLVAGGFGFPADGSCVYLSPGPLYHAAPLRWAMTVHRLGGTVVVMERFDAEGALAAIERHRVNSSQWVPTHFVRLLKLPEEVRHRYDLSSHARAVHAAAPCPVEVKREMIAWWGPILLEYYAGSEGNGMTLINSADWLEHPGSVGRAIYGTLHICDEQGAELPAGETGLVYWDAPQPFAYHNDAAKTAAVTHPQGWTTLGDIGRVDADGFLTLTDRQSHMIISGGVNIYPQEIENHLVGHPAVVDAAVIGVPDPEMGEQVVAVVQPADPGARAEELGRELEKWLAPRLARYKMPRRYEVRAQLPREANGKLYKHRLKAEFAARAGGAGG